MDKTSNTNTTSLIKPQLITAHIKPNINQKQNIISKITSNLDKTTDNLRIFRGVGVLTNLKVATFLFSQLSKYGILIKRRVGHLDQLESTQPLSLLYNFLITDCCVNELIKWEKYLPELPEIRFFLVSQEIDNTILLSLQKLGFVLIFHQGFSISVIANQILNVLDKINLQDNSRVPRAFYFKDRSRIEDIRVILPNREFFIFTKLLKAGFLQYQHHTVKLSALETTIFYELVYAYKWALGTLVKFPLLSYRQITNTISRLRRKLRKMNFPLTIKNGYTRGYYLEEVNKRYLQKYRN